MRNCLAYFLVLSLALLTSGYPYADEKGAYEQQQYGEQDFENGKIDAIPSSGDGVPAGQDLTSEPVTDTKDASSWFQDLSDKWGYLSNNARQTINNGMDTLEDTAADAADSARDTMLFLANAINTSAQNVASNFKRFLDKFGVMVHRGGGYVMHRVAHVFGELKGSDLLERLQRRMEEGDEAVDEFFQKVGEKVTAWIESQRGQSIDEGLTQESQSFSQHFVDPRFPELFQDPEILPVIGKLLNSGVLSQKEADELTEFTDLEVLPANQPQIEERPTQIIESATQGEAYVQDPELATAIQELEDTGVVNHEEAEELKVLAELGQENQPQIEERPTHIIESSTQGETYVQDPELATAIQELEDTGVVNHEEAEDLRLLSQLEQEPQEHQPQGSYYEPSPNRAINFGGNY